MDTRVVDNMVFCFYWPNHGKGPADGHFGNQHDLVSTSDIYHIGGHSPSHVLPISSSLLLISASPF